MQRSRSRFRTGADPWKVGWQATRLVLLANLLPFAFVLKPTLVLVGAPVDIVVTVGCTIIGTVGLIMGWGDDYSAI